MRFRALRGVCIGPGRHLAAGEDAELDPATSTFLVSIGAVEAAPPPATKPADTANEPTDDTAHKASPKSASPAKSGKKE